MQKVPEGHVGKESSKNHQRFYDHQYPVQDYLDRAEAALYLSSKGYRTTRGTLQKLACVGGGPKYFLWGNRALYRQEDLLSWAQGRTSAARTNTSE